MSFHNVIPFKRALVPARPARPARRRRDDLDTAIAAMICLACLLFFTGVGLVLWLAR